MKKSIKILTLVLSLALICSALVVAAFADDTTGITGIRVDASADLENPTKSEITRVEVGADAVTTTLDTDNGAKKPFMFKHQGGGDAKLVVNPIDNNTYVTVEWGATTGNAHFLEHYTAINGWGVLKDDATEYYDEFKYYVVDFDVAYFDVANAQSGSFFPYIRYTKADGKSIADVNTNLGINFTKSNGQMTASFRGGDGTKYAVGNDEWSHITWIMEPIVITDENGENLKIKQYLAIDGEVVAVREWTNTVAADAMYGGNRTHYYTLDVRLDVFGTKGSSGCVDNYNFRTFLPEYNGNLATVLAGGVGADLTKFESNLYDANKMPAGQVKATVGDKSYENVEDAVAAAVASSTKVVLAANVGTAEVDQPVVIECGNYTIATLKYGNGMFGTYDEATKTWTVKSAKEYGYAITYTTASGTVGLTADTADAFKTALTNVADGGVVTLIEDTVYTPAAALSVNKNVTLDLNGHVLDMLTTYKGNGWLNIGSGKTFTVLGEEDGSALIAAYSKGQNAAGGTLFTSGDNATITLKGKGLLVSCGGLYAKWADLHVTINIEDCYINHNNGGENPANIYISAGSGTKSAYTLNIKNATVNGLTTAANCPNTTVESVVNIENSVILSTMLNASYNPKTVVNVKGNSYVYGSLAPAKAVNITGENNYFTTNDWVSKATFATGANLVGAELTVKHENYTHPWVVSGVDAAWNKAATLAITKTTESKTYTYTVTVSVDVNFYNGETLLGTVAGKPGATVTGPVASSTPVANGWVNATKSYVYTIPAGTTGTVNVDVKDVATETVYTVGAPKLYLNFDISDNLTGNLYVPATLPEGIQDLKVYQNKIEEGKNRKLSGNYTIGGEAYVADSRWPGGNNADDPQLWIVTFTYEGTALTLTLDANITDYAKKVYNIYEGDAEKMEQMTALLQFVSAANAYAGYVPKGEFNSLYEQMKAKYTVREVPVVEGNIDALSAYLGDASLYSGYNSGLQFAIKNTTYVDANGDTQNVSFKIMAGSRNIGTVSGSILKTGNYNFALWTTKTLTIQVLDVDGVVLAEGTYSLAAYYNSIKGTADAKALALVQAIYALGAIGNVND